MASLAAAAAMCAALAACGEDPVSERTVTVTTATTVPARTAATATPATTTATTSPGATTTGPGGDPVLAGRPDDFPTTGERFLLDRLDRDIARRCTREPEEDRSRGTIAGLSCETQAVYGARSYFELFRNRVAMEAAYSRYRSANHVPVARGQCVPPNGGGRVPGDAPWGFGTEAPSEGRVMCFRADGEVWFVTSVEKINVLAFATADRFGPIDRFWRTVGIPGAEPLDQAGP